jgi:hypothetical protein
VLLLPFNIANNVRTWDVLEVALRFGDTVTIVLGLSRYIENASYGILVPIRLTTPSPPDTHYTLHSTFIRLQ